MNTLGIIGIIVGTAILFVLAYKGWSVYLAAPICGAIVALFSAVNPLAAIKDSYLAGASSMLITIYPVMLLGSVIAEFYRSSGAATSVALGLYNFSKKTSKDGTPSVLVTFIIVNLIGFILAYGGINGVVVAVLVFPIALEMFKSVGIPREIAPGAVLSGSLTSCMIMPGSPQLQNVLPMRHLGTGSMAAAIPGFVCGILILVANVLILTAMTKRELKKGNTFTEFDGMPQVSKENLPNPWYSVVPLIVVFVIFNFLKVDIIGALFVGMVVAGIMFAPYFGWNKVREISAKGALDSCGLALTVCSLSAYGNVVAAMPCFSSITESLVNMPGPALIKAAIALMIVTGVAGSGPAGIGAGLPMLAPAFEAMNLNMNALHRIASFSGVALDTMPSNAGVNVASRLSGFSVAKTYKYCFMTTVLTTSIGTLLVAVMCMAFPGMV